MSVPQKVPEGDGHCIVACRGGTVSPNQSENLSAANGQEKEREDAELPPVPAEEAFTENQHRAEMERDYQQQHLIRRVDVPRQTERHGCERVVRRPAAANGSAVKAQRQNELERAQNVLQIGIPRDREMPRRDSQQKREEQPRTLVLQRPAHEISREQGERAHQGG